MKTESWLQGFKATLPLEGPADGDRLDSGLGSPRHRSEHRRGFEALGAGQYLGAYQLVHELGRGGMGVVWLAYRADGRYQRQVAIKLLDPQAFSPALVARLRNESQILASLDHPNIARLYDAGSTVDGIPYLVMEYIDGERIDTYCQRRALSVDERLELFRRVCTAVHVAHQNLIVHRDIKPTNILVTVDGEVKLLDFGIAKQLGQSPQSRDDLTLVAQQPMTPQYASPEQMRGRRVTTASDIYSLGVLLYKLLSGRLPYAFRTGSWDEIASFLETFGQPPKPSEAVTSETAAPTVRRPWNRELDADATAHLGTHEVGETPRPGSATARVAPPPPPHKLRARLRGDLDAIILKAMQLEPEGRYGSTLELAEDLERHQTGLPVRARPITWRYGVSRFVRRHRVALCWLSVVLVLLLIFVTSTLVQADRLRRERDKLARVSETFFDLFETSSPDRPFSENPTVLELLDSGVERLDAELAHDPVIQATISDLLAKLYYQVGSYQAAQELSEKALALRRASAGFEDPDNAVSLKMLGRTRLFNGDLPGSAAALEDALVGLQRSLGEEHPTVAETYADLARTQVDLGDYAAAEQSFRRALAIHEAVYSPPHRMIAASLASLGRNLLHMGKFREAEPVLNRSLAMSREIHGEKLHLDVVWTLLDLSVLHHERDELAQAEAYQRECLEVIRKTGRGDTRLLTVNVLSALARTLEAAQKFAESEQVFEEVLAIKRQMGHTNEAAYLTLQNNLGVAKLRRGDLIGAQKLLEETLAGRLELYGGEHPFINQSRHTLAGLHHQLDELEKAEVLFRLADEANERLLPTDHPGHAFTRLGLAALLIDRGKTTEAEPLIEPSFELLREILPPEHWRFAQVDSVRGSWLAATGRVEEARPLLVSSRGRLTALRGPDDLYTLHAERWLRFVEDSSTEQGPIRTQR